MLCLLLLFSLLAAAGCEEVNRSFMPLAPGNHWTYRVVSGGRELGTESLRVIEKLRSREADDAGYRRYKVREPEGTATWSEDHGTIMRSSGRSFMTVIQHPPFVDSGWTDTALNGSSTYCTVLRRETVEVPAGIFADCIVVRREAEDLSSTVTQWFAPDVGLVKWRVSRPRTGDVEWQLTSYAARLAGDEPDAASGTH